ncbi:MAG: SOS response-associated peptidase [Candidatus Limnocylindrales bacterium]
MTLRTDPSDLSEIFDADVRDPAAFEELGPRYNVAPTQPVTVVLQRDEGRFIELHRWGLVPAWAASVAVGARMINARAETVASSSAFRASFLKRRCLIPADGFYEWRRDGKARKPFLIHAADDRPLGFAGLWAPWRNPATGEWLLSASVVTTRANDTVSELHNRMPVILSPEEWSLWLDPEIHDTALLQDLMRPADDGLLRLDPVSPLVNNANNEGPELLVAPPVDTATEVPLTLFG